MSKKYLFLILLMITAVLPASAVLKEKDLDNTLSILRSELTKTYQDMRQQEQFMQLGQQRIRENMMDIYTRSSQNSLMLYSQKSGYIFDLTYACHEATDLYNTFQKRTVPFRNYINKFESELTRYDSLIVNLRNMPTMMMTDRARIDRNVCLTLAVSIRHSIKDNNDQMENYITMYKRTEERLRNMNDYANMRYSEIQSNIFLNGGDTYFSIIKNLGTQISSAKTSLRGKYSHKRTAARSQWDVKVIFMLFGMIVIYGLIAFGLNVLGIRFIMPRRFKTDNFRAKQWCIILATSVITLAILLMIIKAIFSEQNFLIMASGLLVEYTWLLSVILVSLLLRLNGDQIKSSFRIYAPLLMMGFIVISFRIVLIPNDLVNLIFPPILIICTLWQWIVIRKHNDNIPKSDVFYTYITLVVFLVSTVCSMVGYTLLSVQILIWWVMQLTCILTITCISGWLKKIGERKHFNEKPITVSWFYELITSVAMPIVGVISFIVAIYWAADVFNMGATIGKQLSYKFIDTDNFKVSFYGIVQVIILYFVFAYINRVVKELLAIHFEKSDHSTAASRNVLARNIVQIIVWGAWFLIALSSFHVSNTWLVVVSGGLSTGLGFASKDILENIYYGISLMAGRVKIGDLIEVGGTRGIVSSINYTSTMLEIPDGSVIAFQNSQLFTENYKNLTKNHGYELDKIEVGVAYGSDIDSVRKMLIENISQLDFLEKSKPVGVVLDNFADSCLTLKVLVWVPVMTFYASDGAVRECIYKTLNANSIEIPFPQTDVHLRG